MASFLDQAGGLWAKGALHGKVGGALALTREPATRRTDFSRRIDARMAADVAARLPVSPGCAFVCGSNAFVDIAADAALALGLEAGAIKTERYGA
jgi:hypothetical protein